MSYQFYKVIHFLGLFMVFSGLGGQFLQSLNANDPKQQPGRKWTAILHGAGLLLVLVAGFGMLAKLQLPIEGWVLAKLLIWLLFGGAGAIASRKRHAAGPMWLATLVLGVLAAYLASQKSFG